MGNFLHHVQDLVQKTPPKELLPEEEDDQKNGNENDEAGLEDWKKRVLHAACC